MSGLKKGKSFKRNGPAKPHKPVDPAFYERGLHLFCDGACEPNPGRGGWGFVVYLDGEEVHSCSGGDDDTTNNVMELTGALRAVQWLIHNRSAETHNQMEMKAHLHCDSQYVVKGCNDWRHGWKKNGWKRGKGGELKNAALWRALDEALTACPITLQWVKGHSGVKGNERADQLSMEAIPPVELPASDDYLTAQYRALMSH